MPCPRTVIPPVGPRSPSTGSGARTSISTSSMPPRSTVRVAVPLPFVPSFVRDVVPLEVTVSADHVAAVDQYGGVG